MFSTVPLLLTLLSTALCSAEVISDDKKIPNGRLRYFYDDEKPDACKNLVILGVGTGMRTVEYDKLSTEIVTSSSTVTMIIDHNPWWLVKTSHHLYANVVNHIVSNLATLVPGACESVLTDKILIGGHSAAGQAAWRSIPLLKFVPDGFVGLDPFRLDPTDTMDIPTLNWGTTQTSCGVTAGNAAKAGYEATNVGVGRVFFQINNTEDGMGHCDFADNGCYGPVCAVSERAESVRTRVGASIRSFIESLYSEVVDKASFEALLQGTSKGQVNVYVNDDTVKRRTRYLRGRFHH